MRSALQKLLSRPSSLELLRFLIDAPGKNLVYSAQCIRQWTQKRTNYNSALVALKFEDGDDGDEELHSSAIETYTDVRLGFRKVLTRPVSKILDPDEIYGEWGRRANGWGVEELDFHSDLSQTGPNKSRLLDNRSQDDVALWAFLLRYRRQKCGLAGVKMFWDAIRSKNIKLPTDGPLADQVWKTFLSLGFEDSAVLQQLVTYANELHRTHGTRWVNLHVKIVQHCLLKGSGNEALLLHHQLLARHPPEHMAFRRMCGRVARRGCSLSSLKGIYQSVPNRKVYDKVVPALMSSRRRDLEAAVKWHFFLVSHGDLPSSAEVVQPLIEYLRSVDVPLAINLIKDLAQAGLQIVPHLEQTAAASRVTINSIYGNKFNIRPRSYNDQLGARWLATSWVPLDVAIGIIHTLGLQEIGPLSLQAIALRDVDPRAIHDKIKYLKGLGISIGASLFSRAVEHFASTRDSQNLESLLTSDQHPDELENPDLQENLLTFFSERGDWIQFRRILAVQSLRRVVPSSERQNLILRLHARRGDLQSVQESLSLIQETATSFVTGRSIALILRCILRPRRRSNRPASIKELDLAISIMKQIAESGSYVPAKTWPEILKRLGMCGSYSRLYSLSDYLVEYYAPAWAHVQRLPSPPQTNHARLPSPPPHPFQLIFSVPFQRSVIEWGFIHVLKNKRRPPVPHQLPLDDSSARSPLRGIEFLKHLHTKGVPVDLPALKRALKHRLTIYYGPGRSAKVFNRVGTQLVLSTPGVDADMRALMKWVFDGDDSSDIGSMTLSEELECDESAGKGE
ncbi:hypothetical protein BJ875DRAFT_395733 [Amylocarpus encephaloides]|uniref:Pentatricopeptide repeat domain-containing protein n=1 Tax=Amylocarpus encephaloides TaxID=45428 RepID=A0A9P7YNQ5_9HELO|nr:hypothetical protein BJ875DRAFT_395733 [Amylocarpus encephaloides]